MTSACGAVFRRLSWGPGDQPFLMAALRPRDLLLQSDTRFTKRISLQSLARGRVAAATSRGSVTLTPMAFEIRFATRHTDAFAGTGFVHAGVLLALTEMAYAAFEEHCGISKPDHVYAVQRATEVTYSAPLRWDEGATIRVKTLEANERGFDQEFQVVSTADERKIARFVHHWTWLDTVAQNRVPLSEDTQRKLLAG